MNNQKPDKIVEINYYGKQVKFEIFLCNDFSNLKNSKQETAFIISGNKMLLVACKNKVWNLPGGGVETGEKLKDTIVRECYEEAAIKVTKEQCLPFYFQRTYIYENGVWEFENEQLRYIIKDFVQEEFKSDPDSDDPVLYHQYVEVAKLADYLKWQDTLAFIVPKLLKLI